MMPLAHWTDGAASVALRDCDPSALRWAAAGPDDAGTALVGPPLLPGAYSGLLHATADMNTLIAVGTGAAYVFSVAATIAPGLFTRAGLAADVYYEAVAMIIALILLGKVLEARAKGRTSDAIRRLMGFQPKTARVMRDGVEAGRRRGAARGRAMSYIVRPGDKIPLTVW
jgi:P-type Cu+ transporter